MVDLDRQNFSKGFRALIQALADASEVLTEGLALEEKEATKTYQDQLQRMYGLNETVIRTYGANLKAQERKSPGGKIFPRGN